MAPPDPNSHRVVVVDDSPTVRRVLSRTLERAGHQIETVESVEEALDLCEDNPPSMFVIDEALPDGTGADLIDRLRREIGFQMPLVITTSRAEPAQDGLENGPGVHHLPKPFSPKELVALVDDVLLGCVGPGDIQLSLMDTGAGGPPHPAAPAEMAGAPDEFADLIQGATNAVTDGPAQSQPVAATDHRAADVDPPKENRRRRRRRRDTDDVTDQLDRLLRKHLEKRIPAIVKGAMYDTLCETGLVARSRVQMSGSLDALGLPEMLGFVETVGLTGRMAVLSEDSYGEVWCDTGRFVFASATRPVAGSFLAKLLKDVAGDQLDASAIQRAIVEAEQSERRIGEVLRERELLDDRQLETLLQHQALEAFAALLEVDEGMFFFEVADVPERLSDVTTRTPLRSVLMDGLRLLDEKLEAERTLGDDGIVLGKLMSEEEARDSFKFTPAELELFDMVDGSFTLGELLELSPLTVPETKRVFARLQRVGLLRIRTAA